MKRIIALLLIFIILLPIISACSGDSEKSTATVTPPGLSSKSSKGLEFELNNDKKTYTLVGYGSCNESDIVIGTYNGAQVTAIADRAFMNNKGRDMLKSVKLCEGVLKVGDGAFSYARNLEAVTLPSTLEEIGNAAFKCCVSLVQISIPHKVEKISAKTFYGCTKLKLVNFSTSGVLEEIGDSAFVECESLVTINIPNGVKVIRSRAFSDCIELTGIALPDTLQDIEEYAFFRCEKLGDVTIPEGVTQIKPYTFYDCSSLERVVLPATLDEIGKFAFCRCNALESINISGVKKIDSCAFMGVEGFDTDTERVPENSIVTTDDKKYKLEAGVSGEYAILEYIGNEKDIVIPKEYNGKKITKILSGAFSHVKCDTVTIPNTIKTMSNAAFSVMACGCMDIHGCTARTIIFEQGSSLEGISAYAFYNNKNLETIHLPDSVTIIGSVAFCGCESLKDIKLSPNITTIGNEAFGRCDSLEKIELPSKLTKIPDFMFYGASALKDVTIPNGVTEIGSWAFASCISLESINIPASVVKMDDPYLYCSSVESIEVDPGNPVYMSSGNCLIDIYSKTLIRGCNNSIIPDNGTVMEIADNAFSYCKGLKSVNIPVFVYAVPANAFTFCNSLESITCDEDNKVYYAVGNCLIEKETKKLVLGSVNSVIPDDGSVEIIGRYSFHGRKLQGTFVIPEGVTTIEQTSFTGSTLTGIDLPDSLTALSGGAFNASKLESITLPGGVNVYGMLFMNCEHLKTVVISEGAESIGEYAFRDCIALENVVIPSTVKTIGNYAFQDCTALKTIRFEGTRDQWANVKKSSSWNDKVPATYVICIDGNAYIL